MGRGGMRDGVGERKAREKSVGAGERQTQVRGQVDGRERREGEGERETGTGHV